VPAPPRLLGSAGAARERERTTTGRDLFDLTGRVAVVTGGAGLLGRHHLDVLHRAGAAVVSLDLEPCDGRTSVIADITDADAVAAAAERVRSAHGAVDILVNNAARNPKVEDADRRWSRVEHFPRHQWELDLAVGLTGAFIASQVFGSAMAERGRGVILNVCSDLAVIAPDQRLYRRPDLPEGEQPVKPISYSVVKHGLLGMTRYLATYWAERGVRVNAISPGGVENGQDPTFVQRLSGLIPLGRMARPDEYEGAVLFLCSDASSYLTGHNLVVDGGRTCW
jgi:NAD(P)-dependent dehydrogenase (short-subunit alcohol dehydrogenase family)